MSNELKKYSVYDLDDDDHSPLRIKSEYQSLDEEDINYLLTIMRNKMLDEEIEKEVTRRIKERSDYEKNRRLSEPFHTLMLEASIGYNDPFHNMNFEVLEKYSCLLRDYFYDIGVERTIKYFERINKRYD